MESQQAYNLKNNDKPKNVRKKLYIFLFCFIVSSFIWLIIKLSDEYSEVHSYPLVYSNIPDGKVLINETDTVLTINLKSKGFRMLYNSMFFKSQTIVVDIAQILHKIKNSKNGYFILTDDITQATGEQIHQQNNIISISPDTLLFSLVDKYSKKVQVKTMMNITYAQQFGLSDSMIVFPDSVLLNGPKEIIDSIQYITTVAKTLGNVSSSQVLMLNFPDSKEKLVSIKPGSVSVYVPVDKFTEAKAEVPVVISGSEKNLSVKTFPEKVTVTYVVPLSKYNKIDAGRFSATADISKAKSANAKKLKVEITKQPSFVRILKIEPEKIEYILLK
ncbi:MAG: hypothetical protein V1904_00845 [Bacteroidota bacterium]